MDNTPVGLKGHGAAAPSRINLIEKELETLRKKVAELESELAHLKQTGDSDDSGGLAKHSPESVNQVLQANGLTAAEIRRYSRQLLLPEISIEGQLALKNASVLIAGAGGLGAPASLYLAAMGIGRIGIVDHDVVDESNLHRQVIHTEARVSTPKVESAKTALNQLNSACRVETHNVLLDSTNAMKIAKNYDIVVDATDNPATRYLLNDVCVLLGKPLVSGSAVRLDGQLTVYNYNGGPCYRCMFPKPTPPSMVMNCSETGVLGVVPGIIGCLEAMEVVKVLTGIKRKEPPSMLIFSYKRQTPFQSIKIRSRRVDCAVCGDKPTITEPIDYVQFCGSGPDDKAGPPAWKLLKGRDNQVTCGEYRRVRDADTPHILLDVRDEVEFKIVSLPHSINIPLSEFEDNPDAIQEFVKKDIPIYTICKRGNYSQMAVVKFREKFGFNNCFNVIGGIDEWSRSVDPTVPTY